jgi:hypothetical protein
VRVARGLGARGWAEPVATAVPGAAALAAGDLDGDGHADLVASKGDATLWVLLGDGEGGFSREQSEELALPDVIGCRSYGMQLRDLDGDGAAEIVAGIAGEGGDFMGGETCPSGGSLRVWKAAAKPSRRAAP